MKDKYQLQNKKIVLFVGSLSKPSHPVDLLIYSFKLLIEKEPRSHLVIVGGGEEYDNLLKLTEKLNLADKVTFVGKISPDKIAAFYYLADVSVDPVLDDDSAKGRCPLKMFESWICGIPFVSVDVGDRMYLLGNPPAGILASSPSPEEIADAIYKVISDEKIYQTLRQRGLERVKEYSWDKIAEELSEIYLKNFHQ